MKSKEILFLSDLYDNNKLSHAYLIETNNQDFCVDELLNLTKKMSCLDTFNTECSKCNLCNMIDNYSSLNVFLIEPDGKNIKKDQVLELQKKCSTKPVLSKNNIYIIKNADSLNSSSSNTMLKFIEEPVDNLYGFFIVNNKDNVINTIKSRCEVVSVFYEEEQNLSSLGFKDDDLEKFLNIAYEYLLALDNNKALSILNNKYILNDIVKEKEVIQKFLNLLYMINEEYFRKKVNLSHSNYFTNFSFLEKYDINILLKKKKIISDCIGDLQFNLNTELLMDRFIIELGEI